MSPPVRISEIGLYLRCPRLVYFESLGESPREVDAGHILLHSLMLSLSRKSDLEGQLKEILARLEEELPLVYEIEPEEIGPACRELEGEIASIARGLAGHIDQLIPCQAEVELYSDKLGLSGRLDRLAPGSTPSLIRTGKAPPGRSLEEGQAHAGGLCPSLRREAEDAHQSGTGGVSAPGPGASRADSQRGQGPGAAPSR